MERIFGPINLWINKAEITDLTFKELQNSIGCPIFTLIPHSSFFYEISFLGSALNIVKLHP